MQIGRSDDAARNDEVQQDGAGQILASRAGGGFLARPFGFCDDGLIPLI
ncbi:MAG: hypothetical protein ABI357_09020 [Granulicella sp.]